MKKVLIAQKVPSEAIDRLNGKVEIAFAPRPDDATVRECLPGCDGLIVRTGTKLSAATIEQAVDLKVIARTGAGYDNIDVAAATRAGIVVCATPDANTRSVAEHAMAMILAIAKDLRRLDMEVRSGNWAARDAGSARDLRDKTLGIIGLGRIGREVNRLAVAFGMRTVGFDAFLPIDGTPEGMERKGSIDEVLGCSDFVTIHVPLSAETKHLIDEKRLARMKRGGVIVNTSRGGIIDEAALVDALNDGKLAGAGLDVFEEEPLSWTSSLCGRSDVLLTPHSAALSKECKVRVAVAAAESILEFFDGKIPEGTVNREVFANRSSDRII